MTTITQRQRQTLAELRTILAEGQDDYGRPLSPEARTELEADISSLEQTLKESTP